MSYPEKILADDEQVVEHLHPHWITLVPATLWFIADLRARPAWASRSRRTTAPDGRSC